MSAPLWEGRRVVMCMGTGGVGKTTTAAAIALAAAASGKRTLVMTIDPARRLANAMGLTEFGNVEREISPEATAARGVTLRAPLWAMMPDVKRTFDDLINRVAPDDERREKIFHNRFYQQFSTVLAGSLEYAAVEKLYEVYVSERYDLIVLDTPPSQNATQFLAAPGKILDFLEQDSLHWLLKPYAAAGKFSFKLLDWGNSFVMGTLGRMAGGETIAELANFILGFQGMYEGFRDRSARVRALLSSDEVGFVLVTSPLPAQVEAARALKDGLRAEGMRVRALVANRVRTDPLAELDERAVRAAVQSALPADSAAQVMGALREESQLARINQEVIARLHEVAEGAPLLQLPELPLDAHDLDSLVALHRAFLPPSAS